MNGQRSFPLLVQLPLWGLGNSVAGAVIGLAVGFFKGGGMELPTVVISVLFGNVVGFTAMLCSVVLFPRLLGLPTWLRLTLLAIALLSGAIAGTIAVLNLYPLFIISQPRQTLAVVAINGILAVIVGGVVYAYEGLRLRLQASLREIEEVRLVQSRLREEAARAELAALQARINPHFFFNTLNTISSLLGEDPERAEHVVQTLADLFRYTFKAADTASVTLGEELKFIRDYLTIEQARFAERLRVVWRVESRTLELRVPGLILQPLVENAVAHGIATRSAGGEVRITSRRVDGSLVLEVADDGVGLSGSAERLIRDGHGLDNVRRRLAAHGSGARLVLEPNRDGRGALARLELPARRAPEVKSA